MATTAPARTVKLVGTNGQISLGKEYAGRKVRVEVREPGVWLLRTAHRPSRQCIPDNECSPHEARAPRSPRVLNKIRSRTCRQLYCGQGFKWEKVASARLPEGIDAIYALRITQGRCDTAYRDEGFICLLTIATDYDAT